MSFPCSSPLLHYLTPRNSAQSELANEGLTFGKRHRMYEVTIFRLEETFLNSMSLHGKLWERAISEIMRSSGSVGSLLAGRTRHLSSRDIASVKLFLEYRQRSKTKSFHPRSLHDFPGEDCSSGELGSSLFHAPKAVELRHDPSRISELDTRRNERSTQNEPSARWRLRGRHSRHDR